MAWFGNRTTSVRRHGASGTSGARGRAAVVAVAVSIGLVGAGASPAEAWQDDTADDVVAWTNALQGFVLSGQDLSAFEVRETDATIYPSGINDSGTITGEYIRRDGESGFVRSSDGRLTTFDVRGAQATEASKINDEGEIVGLYVDDAGATRAFLLAGEGYTTLSAPGGSVTIPAGINDDGAIVGYTADDLMLSGASGFRRLPGATPQYETVAVPGAPRTLSLGINDRGDVVGLNEKPDETATWPNAAEEWMAMSAGGSTRLDLVEVRGITVNGAIAVQVEELLAAAEADGISFTGGGYRSPERQVELRRQHCGTSYYAIYEMPSSQCSPPTARPGRSLHERGLAIDFSCGGELVESHSDPCFRWLDANAARFGFFNLPSEAWHWSVTGQ